MKCRRAATRCIGTIAWDSSQKTLTANIDQIRQLTELMQW